MPLNLLNVFALASSGDTRISEHSSRWCTKVAIASIAAHREQSAKCFRKITPICHNLPRMERATPAMRKAEARTENRADQGRAIRARATSSALCSQVVGPRILLSAFFGVGVEQPVAESCQHRLVWHVESAREIGDQVDAQRLDCRVRFVRRLGLLASRGNVRARHLGPSNSSSDFRATTEARSRRGRLTRRAPLA